MRHDAADRDAAVIEGPALARQQQRRRREVNDRVTITVQRKVKRGDTASIGAVTRAEINPYDSAMER
jgi:hypothetical protein